MFDNFIEEGMTLEDVKKYALKNEMKLFEEVKNNIQLEDNVVKLIQDIKEPIYLVVAAETWCPFARAFLTTAEKIIDLNKNIKLSIVSFGRGLVFMSEELGIDEDDFVIPTVTILDKNKKLIDKYIAYPEKFKDNFKDIKEEFFKGYKANDIVTDLFKHY